MQKIIFLVLGLCCVQWLYAQPDISRVEYFFNTDPGFGSGTNVPVSAAPNLTDISFSANISGLQQGINSLYLRSQDVNGNWSLSNRFLFIRGPVTTSAAAINRVEYFINTDPGFGNANAISVSPAADISGLTAAINLTGVPEGLNSLFIRSQDINGRWSFTNRFMFVQVAVPATNNITAAEYFFDTDPGFGNASSIAVVPGADLNNLAVNTDISALSLGLHSLFIRSKNTAGKWGHTNRLMFIKINGTLPDISAAEYFIDADPGIGNAIPVAINPATNLPDFIMNVNITGLSVGNHKLFLRSKDANGMWSITNVYTFPIASAEATPLIAVNSMTKKMLCGSNGLDIAYHSTGTYNPGNVFSAQLSDAGGNFASAQTIGTLASTASGLIHATVPLQIPDGNGYKVRVVSNSPAVTGLVSDTLFTLFTQPRFNDTAVIVVCANDVFNLNSIYNTNPFTVAWSTGNTIAAPIGIYQLITSNTAMCKDTARISVQQDVARWTGTISSDWHNAGNWNIGRIPGEKTHVIIPSGTVNPCVISTANARVASVQGLTGSGIQTNNGRVLEIVGQCASLPTQ